MANKRSNPTRRDARRIPRKHRLTSNSPDSMGQGITTWPYRKDKSGKARKLRTVKVTAL